jgi:hypothetical protein
VERENAWWEVGNHGAFFSEDSTKALQATEDFVLLTLNNIMSGFNGDGGDLFHCACTFGPAHCFVLFTC